MTCHYCGAEIRGNEPFCRHCGTRQQRAPQTEAEISTPVQAEPVILQEAAVQTPAKPAAPDYVEKTFDWQPYGAPAKEEPLVVINDAPSGQKPALQLPVKRSLVKMIFLGLLTFGIYPLVIWSRLTSEVNLVASRYDGKRSMPFLGMLMLSPLTLGIHSLVWMNKLCNRIGDELLRRGAEFSFSAKDFWIWAFLMGILSSICFGVCGALASIGFDVYIVLWLLLAVGFFTLSGPFVFTAKLMKAVNCLNADYNIRG